MENLQTEAVEKIKTHIFSSVDLIRKSCRLCEDVDKYCSAGQCRAGQCRAGQCRAGQCSAGQGRAGQGRAGHRGVTTRRPRIACWITKATSTSTLECVTLITYQCNNGCTNAPRHYVTRTLRVEDFVPTYMWHDPQNNQSA
jgi:hypothetical protein